MAGNAKRITSMLVIHQQKYVWAMTLGGGGGNLARDFRSDSSQSRSSTGLQQ
jgi:hypothetical protein